MSKNKIILISSSLIVALIVFLYVFDLHKVILNNFNKSSEIRRHIDEYKTLNDNLITKYSDITPTQWGENTTGVKTRIKHPNSKIIALTFDACGGSKASSGYDKNLIDFLIQNNVPATLFINSRWIDSNRKIFMDLSKNKLFEIENHGTLHKPLSVNGKSVYGIEGTKNVKEVIDEVVNNQIKIEGLTGRKPKFFRSGTAYYDDVSIKILNDMGLNAAGFSILGDAGATFNRHQIYDACLKATPGSIIIAHMNHPEKETAEGMKLAIPELKKRGFTFVKLEHYELE